MNLHRRQEEEEPEFQMAPMIDIVFLLLIFFMTVSSFHVARRDDELKLPVAKESKTREAAHGDLTINVQRNGSIMMNNAHYETKELEAELRIIAKRFSHTSVIIRGDAGTRHAVILEVMRACAVAGIYDVSFAALQSEPQ